jgi:hypothetical protein
MVYDENIKSQADLDAAGIEGQYQGEDGWAINEQSGDWTHYKADGSTESVPKMLDEVEVTLNPIQEAVYKAQEDFIDHPVTQGAVTLSTSVIPLGPSIKGAKFLQGAYAKYAPKLTKLVNNKTTQAVIKADYKLNQVKRMTMEAFTPSKRTYVKIRSLNSTTRKLDKSLRSFYSKEHQIINTINIEKSIKARDNISNIFKLFDDL